MATAVSSPPAPAPPVRRRVARWLVPLLAAGSLAPGIGPAPALLAGVLVAVTLGNPWPLQVRALAQRLLAASVVGLGAGMNLAVVGRVGLHGLLYTAVGIALAFAVGTWLGRRLGVAADTSLLVTVGTAICGGSAIAAVAPAIRAKDHDVSMALVTVFLLNGVALVAFPALGRALHMAPDAFGLWCALAIHDTSSVVGAASQLGPRALEVATAAKLARALWIVPVTIAVATLRARQVGRGRPAAPKRPWFIAGFVAAAALATDVPALHTPGLVVSAGAHRALVATLFLIGLGLSRDALRSLGPRPFVLGLGLWLAIAGVTLGAIQAGWVT